MLSRFSHVRPFVTLWTMAHQAPLSVGFPRQEYWSGLPFPFPGDPLDPRIEPTSLMSPALTGRFFFFLPLVPPGKPIYTHFSLNIQPSPRTWLTPKRLILFGDHVCLRRKMSPVPLHRGYLFWLEELRQTC